MKIIVNEYGQIKRVEQSHLVANGSLQLRISVEIEGITQKQKEQMAIGYLSVIREDGFEIVDLLMERDVSGANLVFSHKVQDSSQILAIPGNIQISAQIKALKEEYLGTTEDELQNLENYYTFATVTCVGFVHKNIGSVRERNYANALFDSRVLPLLNSVGELQNNVAKASQEIDVAQFNIFNLQNDMVAAKQDIEEIQQNYITKEEAQELKAGEAKNYINLSEYVVGDTISYYAINQRIEELAAKSKGGQDRVEIYFYQSNPEHVFDFKNEIIFQSNCNYYFLGAENYGGAPSEASGLFIAQVSNCRFTGFKIGIASEAGAAIQIVECSNIEFYDCVFNNIYSRGLIAYDSRAIYFNDCVISAGNYPSGQNICCFICDSQTTVGQIDRPSWIVFENCYFRQATVDASEPLVDCSNVSNTNSLVSILHCVTNGMEDVTASNVSKGSGKIRISQLTNV